MTTVSVIIPNYNHAPFLKERIDSVLNQTFQDFEVIILDDKSPDNSIEIIESYRSHPKVSHIVFNEENSGSTFKQWEKGISLAQGEWIWIAESDDVAEKEFLEELLLKASKGENIALSFCASIIIDENSLRQGAESWAKDISDRDWSIDFYNEGITEIKTQLFFKNTIPNASATILKKSKVDMAVFNEISNMKFAGDWLFWIKLLENGNIAYNPKELNLFRCHNSTTRNVKSADLENKRFSEYFKVLNYLQKKYRLPWNHKKHDWILKEWVIKHVKKSVSSIFNPNFPLRYNTILFYKFPKEACDIIISKIKNAELTQLVRCIAANWARRTSAPSHFPTKEHLIDLQNRKDEGIESKQQTCIPKIIWAYWETEEIPDYTEKMWNRIKNQNPEHKFMMLNANTLRSYLPDLKIPGGMPIANKMDIIRLELLYNYGGIWFDCTTIIGGSLEWVHELDGKHKYDLIGYYRDASTTDYSYPVIESWFLCAHPKNAFIKEWLEQLSTLKNLGSKNYFQLISQREDYAKIKQQIDSPEYLLAYLTCQLAMRKYKHFNLYLKKAEDSALYIHGYYKGNYSKINYALFRLNIPSNCLPIIKLTSGSGSLISLFDKSGLIKDNSIMGRVLKGK